jgi:hypothetical protein
MGHVNFDNQDHHISRTLVLLLHSDEFRSSTAISVLLVRASYIFCCVCTFRTETNSHPNNHSSGCKRYQPSTS